MADRCILAKILYTGRKLVSGSTIKGIAAKATGKMVGEYPVVTPAFIDPHSHIGLIRAGEPASEEEANEKMESLIALPDALDSLQMDPCRWMTRRSLTRSSRGCSTPVFCQAAATLSAASLR